MVTWTDIGDFVVAIIAAAASTGVGFAAWITSRRAVAIATAQRTSAYDEALNDSVAGLLERAGDYIATIERWQREMDTWVPARRFITPGAGSDEPVAPSPHPLSTALLAVRIRARGSDKQVTDAVATWWNEVRHLQPGSQLYPVNEITKSLGRWRGGELNTEQAVLEATLGAVAARERRSSIDELFGHRGDVDRPNEAGGSETPTH